MEPLTAVGLASAIVCFVEVGAKVAVRMKELSAAGDIPEVCRDIRTRLPFLMIMIVSTERGTDNLSPESKNAFEEIVRQCFKQVSQLDEILNKVRVSKDDSRFKRSVRAVTSLVEEGRVQRIATGLRDNVHLLTLLNVTPTEKERPQPERKHSEALPSYMRATGACLVPFSRDEQVVGRKSILLSITSSFETQSRVAISGIGGVG